MSGRSPAGLTFSRWAWVAGVSRVPVARVRAQLRRSGRSEIIAPAAQPQEGFQSVASSVFPVAVWFV